MIELITLDGQKRKIIKFGMYLGEGIYYAIDNWNCPRIVGRLWECTYPYSSGILEVWTEYDPENEEHNRTLDHRNKPQEIIEIKNDNLNIS